MPSIVKDANTRIVQSRQNSRVKELRAALRHAGKTDSGLLAIEGFHLLEEAVRSGLRIRTLFLEAGWEQQVSFPAEEVLLLSKDVMSSAVSTGAPQPVAALIEPPQFLWESLLASASPLIVISAAIQDPGNLGTIVRSAEAFGATGVLALPGTVSLWNPKTLRASAGSAFRLPIISATQQEALTFLRQHRVCIFAATVEGGADARLCNLEGPAALLIGNEGNGLSESLLAASQERITLACPGPVESLNAAVAASVLLYEASTQRQRKGAKP